MAKILLLNKDVAELEDFVVSSGEPRYRTKQLLEWLYQKHAASFDEMTNLSKSWRATLRTHTLVSPFCASTVQISADQTRKYRFQLHDGAFIESVYIPMNAHATLCISTQVGCALQCAFCLTGKLGLERNLRSGEILGQILAVQRDIPTDRRISNIVLMGMGEPLLNYKQTVKALRMMLAEKGLNLSNRKITLSTAGILPGMQRLGQEDFTINLAVSLNAPTEELRSRLMPINRTYSLKRLLEACRHYPLPARRRITFEYIMLDGMNDSPEMAKQLAGVLQGIRCKINLIPFNATPETPFRPSPEERILVFQDSLLQRGFSTFIRASKGDDISAACGQLGTR